MIEARICVLKLENQRVNSVGIASESSSKVEMQQPENKKPINEAVTKNQVRQPKEKEHTNEAVSKDQVEVQQPAQKKPSDVANTMNEVRVQQPEGKQSVTTESVTRNQVEVQQPRKKKRANEGVAENYQSHQRGNSSKRHRTGVIPSMPSVLVPQYQRRAFIPSAMPAQFVFPPNYISLANNFRAVRFRNQHGANYFHHSRPHPFR